MRNLLTTSTAAARVAPAACSMTPTDVLAKHTQRAARVWDRQSLTAVRNRGLGAAHALHAVGLLNDGEHANAIDTFLDVCDRRATELAADDSEGGVQ